MLVGNKVDRESERVISTERGKSFATEHGLLFQETSAHSSIRVREAFEDLLKEIFKEKARFDDEDSLRLKRSNKPEESCC